MKFFLPSLPLETMKAKIITNLNELEKTGVVSRRDNYNVIMKSIAQVGKNRTPNSLGFFDKEKLFHNNIDTSTCSCFHINCWLTFKLQGL